MNFVERVAATIHGGGSKGGPEAFNPVKLKESFEETIKSLQRLMKEAEGRMVKLEKICTAEEKEHKSNSLVVEEQYKVICSLIFAFDWNQEEGMAHLDCLIMSYD